MSVRDGRRVLVLGGGPAGRAAMAALPGATLVARPEVTVWHAEPGRLWLEDGTRVWPEDFDALLVCADEPLLLVALGCTVAGGRVVVAHDGATSEPGVYAAGRVAGAANVSEAVAQAGTAAAALRAGSGPTAGAPFAPTAEAVRLDPVGIAALLERPVGPSRNAEVLAQCAALGSILPARPVGLTALASLTSRQPPPLPPQPDGGGAA